MRILDVHSALQHSHKQAYGTLYGHVSAYSLDISFALLSRTFIGNLRLLRQLGTQNPGYKKKDPPPTEAQSSVES